MIPRRLLVIDDSPTVIARVRHVLGGEYAVRSASGAWEALAEVRTQPPDVILLDLAMPAVGGEVLAGKLRSIGCLAPIVILTDASRAAADQARLRLNAASSLDKGCSDAVLRMTVATALLLTIHGGGVKKSRWPLDPREGH